MTNQLFVAIKKAEKKFIEANKSQLYNKGENFEGNVVGTYAPSTQGYADADGIFTMKKEGKPYNFLWSGDFFKEFQLSISNEEVTILSNVQGSDDKIDFLTTNKLYGLNEENLKFRIQQDILPFIQNFARTTLKI